MSAEAAPEVKAAEKAGPMAMVIVQIFQAAAAKQPRTARRLRGALALSGTDADLACTIRFEGSRILVSTPADPGAELRIEAPMAALAKLGRPRDAMRAMRAGEVKLRGALRHPLILMRLRRLLGSL